jgi:two-component system KDP operon response regulator KdpE
MSRNPQNIAVIEDDAPMRKFLRAALKGEGFGVLEAETAREGLRIITQEHPALVILDLGLPDQDGLEVIREVRDWSSIPILILSARDQEKDKITALDAGADDYLMKPFGIGELLARIRVALRHAARLNANEPPQTTFEAGSLKVDLASRRVFRDGKEVKLTKLEYELLLRLIQHAGKVLTHRFLLKEVWGSHFVQETHYLRVFMASLCKKLEDDPARPKWLLTEQGVGYRLAMAMESPKAD